MSKKAIPFIAAGVLFVASYLLASASVGSPIEAWFVGASFFTGFLGLVVGILGFGDLMAP